MPRDAVGGITYAQIAPEEKRAMVYLFARNPRALARKLDILPALERHISGPATKDALGVEISRILESRAEITIAEIAIAFSKIGQHDVIADPVVGKLLNDEKTRALNERLEGARARREERAREEAAQAASQFTMPYARLSPDQKNAMIRLFAHDHAKLAEILGVTVEVERSVDHPAPALEFAVMLSRALSKNGGATVAAVANALSSINPGAFHDPVVGQLLNGARRVSYAAPAAAAAAPSAYTWKTMAEIPGPMQLSLGRFFERDAANWLLWFNADAPVRGQLVRDSGADMARGLVHHLRNQAYPLPNLARVVAEHAPLAVDDPKLGGFFQFYLAQPEVATRVSPPIPSGGPWTSMSQIPGSVRAELVKFFADQTYGGVGDWMTTFYAYDDVRARVALPATPVGYARGLVDVLVRHDFPVAEIVDAVLARAPAAIRHPTLGGFFQTTGFRGRS